MSDEERAPGEGDGGVGKPEHAVEGERLLVRGDHLRLQERVLDHAVEEHAGEEPGDGRRADELLRPAPAAGLGDAGAGAEAGDAQADAEEGPAQEVGRAHVGHDPGHDAPGLGHARRRGQPVEERGHADGGEGELHHLRVTEREHAHDPRVARGSHLVEHDAEGGAGQGAQQECAHGRPSSGPSGLGGDREGGVVAPLVPGADVDLHVLVPGLLQRQVLERSAAQADGQ